MQWLALACTAENEVLAWSNSLSTLESACENEFRAICRIYGVDDIQAQQLRQFNLDFKIEFDGPRNTKLVAHRKDLELMALSHSLQGKVGLISELSQRLAHGFKRFTPIVEWQLEAYAEKYKQAVACLAGDVTNIGMVQDYAIETELDLDTAASLIINKFENRNLLIRKLERLRIRYQTAIRNAKTKEDFMHVRAGMDEDSFLSMLM